MEKNAFLKNETAKKLYETVSELPIVDYHCHLSPKEIYEDQPFRNIGEIWLGADHYKWRLMRTAGVEEEQITGNASYKDKFLRYCEALEFAAGNPLYHWSHMELMKYFHIDLVIKKENAEKIWDQANAYIEKTKMSPRKLMEQSGTELLCTTDDVADDLVWHQKIAEDPSFRIRVLPTFRTDRLFQIRQSDYPAYLVQLEQSSKRKINDYEGFKQVIQERLSYFVKMGCRCADIGISEFPDRIADDKEAGRTFEAAMKGEAATDDQYRGFIGNLYLYLAKLYKKEHLLSQWHLGAIRNCNSNLYQRLGADCGVDCMGNPINGNDLIRMLDAIDHSCGLTDTVLYSLNETGSAQIASIAGAFPNVRCGASWWFCDHKRGIENEIRIIAENASLGNFYGMLTDSRSFLSYVRHDYFRQILCNVIGQWVEAGEYDRESAVKLAKKISYENIRQVFA